MSIWNDIFQRGQKNKAFEPKHIDQFDRAIAAILKGEFDALAGVVKEMVDDMEAFPAKNAPLVEPLLVFANHLAKSPKFNSQCIEAYGCAERKAVCGSDLKHEALLGFAGSTAAEQKAQQKTTADLFQYFNALPQGVVRAPNFGEAVCKALSDSEKKKLVEIYTLYKPVKPGQSPKQHFTEQFPNIV